MPLFSASNTTTLIFRNLAHLIHIETTLKLPHFVSYFIISYFRELTVSKLFIRSEQDLQITSLIEFFTVNLLSYYVINQPAWPTGGEQEGLGVAGEEMEGLGVGRGEQGGLGVGGGEQEGLGVGGGEMEGLGVGGGEQEGPGVGGGEQEGVGVGGEEQEESRRRVV